MAWKMAFPGISRGMSHIVPSRKQGFSKVELTSVILLDLMMELDLT
jgi:hypothetical protein